MKLNLKICVQVPISRPIRELKKKIIDAIETNSDLELAKYLDDTKPEKYTDQVKSSV
jgi:hypothetical protein